MITLRQIITVLFQVLLIINVGEGFTIEDGDKAFEGFLINIMNNYSSWLRENQLDPSPPTTDIFAFNENRVKVILQCDLSNIVLSGHSAPFEGGLESGSDFTSHYFIIGRDIQPTLEFQGDLRCTGTIVAYHFPDIDLDIPFGGGGTFVITVGTVLEVIEFYNVGITPDHKLDMTHSWPNYTMGADVKNTRIAANWDEEVINNKYIDVVQEAFGFGFQLKYLYREDILNPSCKLLERYLKGKLENLDLNTIMPPENLPSTYPPTPSPTTTSTTTTTTTPSTTTGSSSTKDTTTPSPRESTTPGDGSRLTEHRTLILLQAVLIIRLIY